MDELIERLLATGPKSALTIWACRCITPETACATAADIQAALAAGIRAGRIRELQGKPRRYALNQRRWMQL